MTVEKLLIIRLGAMGDLVHVSPSLSVLRAERPEMEIHLLTAPMYRELAERLPGVTRVWTLDKRRFWSEMFRLWRELTGITHVVNLHPSLKTWMLARLLHPRAEAVYRKQKFKLRGLGQRHVSRRHAVVDFYEPFRRLLTLPMRDETALIPLLPVEVPVEVENARRIALIPGVGGKRGNRAWPVTSYRKLIRELRAQEPGSTFLLVGGPDDAALAKVLAGEGVENYCGRHGILETAHLLAGCHLVIGGDTGPLHIAAAVGVPVVGIFGPTAVTRTGPLGVRREAIAHLTPPEDLACWPCEYPTCPLPGDQTLVCMQEISVEAVFQACLGLLNR